MTIISVLSEDMYPLPKIEYLFAKLAGKVKFSKTVLSNAYLQLELDGQSRKLVTINTHRGLFQYNRLLFGVSLAWQLLMSDGHSVEENSRRNVHGIFE